MSAPTPQTTNSHGGSASVEQLQRDNKHAPGVLVGNDAAPEFHAQPLPPGTAPPERTFQPNPEGEVPGASHPQTGKETFVSAADTIGGATSADVHTGYGRPVQGETSTEANSKRQGSKLGSLAANGRDPFVERGLDTDHVKGGKANAREEEVRAEMVGAEEKYPETAESLAAEMD